MLGKYVGVGQQAARTLGMGDLPTAMTHENRDYFKNLATRCADSWGRSPSAFSFHGEARAETRNTIYQFREGVCVAVKRRDRTGQTDQSVVGMRLIGWLAPGDPKGGLTATWTPGAYAVLWRRRGPGEGASVVALTSPTRTFVRSEAKRAAGALPPPSAGKIRHWVRPPPPPPGSMTRVNLRTAPPTPTPATEPNAKVPPRSKQPFPAATLRPPTPAHRTESGSYATP
jgi:hypothetical protein